MATHVPAGIFRGNDIRGRVDTDLTAETYVLLGQGYGSFVRSKHQSLVYVGYDSRPTSRAFAEAFVRGLVATGCHVHLLGMVPTPVLYYAATREGKAFGAMITASHLPATYNGVKLCRGSASLDQQEARAIREAIQSEEFVIDNGVLHQDAQIADEYIAYVTASIPTRSQIKIVLDCQNGAASLIAPRLLKEIGTVVAAIHSDPDAPYPFERPDPQIPANLVPLREQVVATGADLGIAYDGDADRLAVVDSRGEYVLADYVLALLAADLLRAPENSGAKVVFDVLSSQTLYDAVTRHGGTPIWAKSGHAFIKEAMVNEGAKLGGESSGHICFADRYLGYDDGIYTSCRLIELLDHAQQPLSALVETLSLYVTSPESRPHCPDDKKHLVIETFKQALRASGTSFTTLDGVEVPFPHGRGVVRASNTEPVLSIRFEASSAAELEQYSQSLWPRLREAAQAHGVTLTEQSH